MLTLGTIGFLQPWFLLGLAALPVLWWLLRATPPAPRRVAFPGVRILLGLDDRERQPERTPWWLLLLRLLAAGFLLLAFAEPLLNPKTRSAAEGPLLIAFDGGWTSAPDWAARRAEALDAAAQAGERDRPVAVVSLAEDGAAPEVVAFGTATAAEERIRGLEPAPWRPDRARLDAALPALAAQAAAAGAVETLWLTDGLTPRDPAMAAAETRLLSALRDLGPVTRVTPGEPPLALEAPRIVEGALTVGVRRPGGVGAEGERAARIAAYGRSGGATDAAAEEADPDADAAALGEERRFAVADVRFAAGESRVEAEIDLPLELRNAVTRIELMGARSAGAVALLDDRHRRRAVALVAGDETRAGQPLLSDLHYLRAALAPHAAARETDLRTALGLPSEAASAAAPERGAATFRPPGAAETEGGDLGEDAPTRRAWADVIVLSDIGRMDFDTEDALADWVRSGGMLVRFAGPRLAALAAESGRSGGVGAGLGAADFDVETSLLPAPLRGGGRALGGALSWSAPQTMRPFPAASPFFGLEILPEVTVSRQVLAEPGPDLADKVWAALADGTPLVTARDFGEGRIVLFHVTASAAWSSLPISGLFVEMVGRVVAAAPGLAAGEAALAEAARAWTPIVALDGFGVVASTSERAEPARGAALAAAARTGAPTGLAPGLYQAETDEGVATLALAAFGAEESFEIAPPPPGVTSRALEGVDETPLKPALLAAALALLALDVAAALLATGRLRRSVAFLALGLIGLGAVPTEATAQSADRPPTAATADRIDPAEQRAAVETVLGYVITGERDIDRMSEAGLLGLSATLTSRTAIEPGAPAGVDLERDEVSVYSVLYWPITPRQPTLSDAAVRRLNAYLATGGMLVVDTQDAHQSFGGTEGPNAVHLRRLLGRLDLPALEPLPRDHVLTRTYYLLDDGPGRWRGAPIWVETGGATGLLDPEALESEPNDGVSPVIVGSVDWAGAWAVSADGDYLAPMGRNGEMQRELAYRFGVNVVMYAFTGNYKSDQVHIPMLLERLGN